jgi:O-antigen/teichoic acid export membrane protein
MADRTAKVARNSVVGIVSQLAMFGVGLVYRTVFIYFLGVEYLGAQSLFGDVLNLLSLAEFGIASAILFSLYAPLAQGDHARSAALLLLYKRLYRVVGLVVLVVGAAATPFVHHLVKPGTELPHFQLIYLLLLLDVVVGYWSAYRKSVFIADQQEYRVTLSNAAFTVGRYVVQGLVLMATGSFLLTLVIKVVGTLATNLYQSWLAGRAYPEIFSQQPRRLEKDFLKDHFRKMRALMLHKISGLVLNATDTILIARFFGLGPAGIYSNYLLIVGMVTSMIYQVANATTASVGHLLATESRERGYRIFRLLEFGYTWVYTFTTLSLLTLLNPFLELWLGAEFTFDTTVVVGICLTYYIVGRGAGVQAFRNARGLFWNDRYRGPAEAVLNIVLSLLLLHELGIAGVFFGTVLSHALLSVWIEPYVVFKHYFARPVRGYLLARAVEVVELAILAVPLLWLQSVLDGGSFVDFLALALACLVLINGALWVRHGRSWQYRQARERVSAAVQARRGSA